MTLKISQLAAAASVLGTELVEVSKLSLTVIKTATTISALAADNSINDSGAGWVAAGFAVGDQVRIQGFTGNVVNNLFTARITALTTAKMTFGGTDGDVIVDDAAGESVTVTKWETKRVTLSEIAAAVVPFTGGTLTSALNEAPAVTIASSATPAIFAAAANTIILTGTTTVTGFDVIAAGAVRRVVFSGILQLTYNATSMINLTAANITTAAGDVAEFESLGSGNTKMLSYTRADGTALVASAGGTEVKGLTFTSDTSSTADSDPGAGKLKWNNATQASATILYIDDQTADAVSLTTFWAGLGSSGYLYMQQADDSTKWQLWKWTAAPVNGTGYRKLTVSLQASLGSIATSKTVYCIFSSGSGGGSTQGLHSIPIQAAGMLPAQTGGCAGLAVYQPAGGPPYLNISYLAFDPNTEESAFFEIAMPKKWNLGTITALFIWSHDTASTNFGVAWGIRACARSDGESFAVGYGTEVIVTDTGSATKDRCLKTDQTSAMTVGSTPSAEDYVLFMVSRKVADAGDTLAIDARLHAVVLYVTTNADTDA